MIAVTEHAETVRSAEQIAVDLNKAMQCSATEVRTYRCGILPASTCQRLMGKVIEPLVRAVLVVFGPLFVVGYLVGASHHTSMFDGLATILSMPGHIGDFAETEGWFHTILYSAIGLGLLGFGVYSASKVPLKLLLDILAKRVRMAEGRVTVREEDKKGSRDPVTYYHFDMKERSFVVTRKAFLAIDAGGFYRVYYLPRSGALVALEPGVLAREAQEKEQAVQSKAAAPEAI